MTDPVAPVTAGGLVVEPTVALDEDTRMIALARRRSGNIDKGQMFTGKARVSNCPRCGNRFVQWELSPRFAEWVAAHRSEKARQAWAETVTENALPLLCISCERRDLSHGNEAPKISPAFGYGD